eukprot:5239540-Amphidinium_carterae.1
MPFSRLFLADRVFPELHLQLQKSAQLSQSLLNRGWEDVLCQLLRVELQEAIIEALFQEPVGLHVQLGEREHGETQSELSSPCDCRPE